MDPTLLEWMNNNIHRDLVSPRIHAFKENRRVQNFEIVEVNERDRRIRIEFADKGTPLYLEFWRFEKVLEILKESRPKFVRLGSRFAAEDHSTIERQLQDLARKYLKRKADLKTAPHVCDIIVLTGLAEYGYEQNPTTLRKNQAIRVKKSRE